ncbi:hypothetical protein Bbelb_215430 [Branchiostoma belcheri]|nr:hypothetical protein Bbelb_215430 [Branchiostoma belcheri]
MKVSTCALLVVVLLVVATEGQEIGDYVGCYVKNYGDVVFPYSLIDRGMSNAMCAQHCSIKGYTYSATKSVRCGCGTEEHLVEMMKAEESDCTNNCKSGGGICGGYARLSVYKTKKDKRELSELLGDLTSTLEKLDSTYKREMDEREDFEEEMREMEEMEAADMAENEEY